MMAPPMDEPKYLTGDGEGIRDFLGRFDVSLDGGVIWSLSVCDVVDSG